MPLKSDIEIGHAMDTPKQHTLYDHHTSTTQTPREWRGRIRVTTKKKPRKAFSGVKRACPGWEQQSAVSDMYRTREAMNEWLNMAIKANHVG